MELAIPPPLLPLLSLPPSTYIQTYFALLGAGCLALQLLPSLNDALLTYGPRHSSPTPSSSNCRSSIVTLLKRTGLLFHVPHAWFSHFYAALLAFQAFWAAQYLSRGWVLTAIAGREVENGGGQGMGVEQVLLAWGMLTVQGARRLYECWAVMRPSASQMLGAHWILSLLVYLAMGMSVWIEGSASLLSQASPQINTLLTARTIAALALFATASLNQHRAHKHLASLRKYTLPHDGLFAYIACPHYTCECLIYVALALASAAPGHLFNRTLLAGLFFVVANLGATAGNTRAWYVEKFGGEKVPRWRMIPFVF